MALPSLRARAATKPRVARAAKLPRRRKQATRQAQQRRGAGGGVPAGALLRKGGGARARVRHQGRAGAMSGPSSGGGPSMTRARRPRFRRLGGDSGARKEFGFLGEEEGGACPSL